MLVLPLLSLLLEVESTFLAFFESFFFFVLSFLFFCPVLFILFLCVLLFLLQFIITTFPFLSHKTPRNFTRWKQSPFGRTLGENIAQILY